MYTYIRSLTRPPTPSQTTGTLSLVRKVSLVAQFRIHAGVLSLSVSSSPIHPTRGNGPTTTASLRYVHSVASVMIPHPNQRTSKICFDQLADLPGADIEPELGGDTTGPIETACGMEKDNAWEG